MSDTPTYGKWVYHIARKWKPPPDISLPKIVGFAVIMASFGTSGRDIWPSAATLADAAHVSVATVDRLRPQCIELGLFRKRGITKSGVPIVDIAIPADYGDHGDNCRCGALECKRRYLAARAPTPI
jgi:hypothetical protein